MPVCEETLTEKRRRVSSSCYCVQSVRSGGFCDSVKCVCVVLLSVVVFGVGKVVFIVFGVEIV